MLSSPYLLKLLGQIPNKEAILAELGRRDQLRQLQAQQHTDALVSADADATKERCKRLAGFVREAWGILRPVMTSTGGKIVETSYVHGWHIDLLCEHLEAITFGRFLELGLENRLLANVPPGMMKSLTVSVYWPAWEWGPCGMPHLQHMTSSFREDNCFRDNRRFRTLVMSPWYQQLWGEKVKIITASESHVENSASGWRKTMPFRSLTGQRADRLTIDDPHSIETAESDADRAKAEMTLRESATTRMNDPIRSAIVLIMQRLHESDSSGVILKSKMPYTHIMLPMRFEIDRKCVTPFGEDPRTEEGELLFPARFPKHVVDRDEAAMLPHAVAGQHQQRPSPRGGLMFKRHWFSIVEALPAGCRLVRGWDLAGSKKKTSPYTVGLLLGYHPQQRRYFIGDVERDRVLNPEFMIKNTADRDGKEVEVSIPQDPGSAGLIQARSIIAALSGYKASASPESGEKVDRALPVKYQAEAGNISMVRGQWNQAFMEELAAFPAGAYKDQVDALSRAFSAFVLSAGVVTVAPIVMTQPLEVYGTHPGV